MIVWLNKELLLAIHDRQLAEHGGTSGVRDDALLESALARPQQLHAYGSPDIADLAATLAYGLARNHPFVDGNKRSAAVACETFIELNGASLEVADLDLFPVYLALAEGKLSEQDFAAWLRPRIQPRAPGEIHEPSQAYRTRRRSRAAKSRVQTRK